MHRISQPVRTLRWADVAFLIVALICAAVVLQGIAVTTHSTAGYAITHPR